MKRVLVNVTQQEELRVALVNGQRLYDLNVEDPGHEQKKANIYKGKITRVEPSLEAASVDCDAECHGFLPLKEIAREYFPANYSSHGHPNTKDVLREGQEVIVQIGKEEHDNKGAALTAFINLTGSYLTLMPDNPRVDGISRHIGDDGRTELEETLTNLESSDSIGLTVCTVEVGKSAEALQQDLSFRLKHWEAIQKAADGRPALFPIHQESNVTVRTFHDYLRRDINEILIDNPKAMEVAHQHVAALDRPGFNSKIELYTGEIPLFNHYQIESQIESAFQREIRLPSGGSIVIDSTEALTAIGINSVRAARDGGIEETAFSTNLGATNEIVRQLRLRDLDGLTVIDFIDMTPVRHQHAVESRLRETVRRDRARIQINHISRFDLLETSHQRLSPFLGESSHHVCPRYSGTGTVCDNESLSPSILRLVGEEALKEGMQEVHTIVPVPIASYLLNGKRTTINTIETRQNGVRCVIMPNGQIETPHYSVLRVRKGEETPTPSCLLPKLREEAVALPIEEEYVERKQPKQPALATFAMPDAPPAPVLQEPAAEATTPRVAAATTAVAAQPGLISHFFGALKSIFGGGEEVKPVEQPAPKAEEKTERQQDRHKPRQSNRRDRNDRRDSHDNRGDRDNRSERSENGENREDNRHSRRQSRQQNVRAHDNRQQTTDVTDKAKSDDGRQAPRRERNRHRNDDKRQAQQKVKELNQAEQSVQDTKQEERVRQLQTRRKQRRLTQEVRLTDNPAVETEVATIAAIAETAVAQPTEQPVPVQRTELAKVNLPAVITTEQEGNSEVHGSNSIPCHSHRSPRHLRVSRQCRRRYRDECYPVQSPMPLAVACTSPELASGKVWIRCPVVHPQDQQAEEQCKQEMVQQRAAPVTVEPQVAAAAVEYIVDTPAPARAVQPEVVVAEPQTAAVETTQVGTTYPEVIVTPVGEQPQIIVASNAPVAKEVATGAEPVTDVMTTPVAEEPAEIIVPQPEVVEEIAEVVETAPVVEEVAAPRDAVATPVVETEVAKTEVVAASTDVEHLHSHVTVPMTRAPAPEYVPEVPRHSDWQRLAFVFEGKGTAGGHSVTRQTTAPTTHPQPVE